MAMITRRTFLAGAATAASGAVVPHVVIAQPSVKVGTAVLGDYALAGPFVLAADQRPDRQAAPPQGRDDGAAHAADAARGPRDQDRTARRHGNPPA